MPPKDSHNAAAIAGAGSEMFLITARLRCWIPFAAGSKAKRPDDKAIQIMQLLALGRLDVATYYMKASFPGRLGFPDGPLSRMG
jgi:hypothetical protein